ncbi:MaoC family dehydratase [Candidatus Kaiserbacteria bacterium]|nr:MaoC family dehydratase [Candidatus Kaiserbacteria bacterium]
MTEADDRVFGSLNKGETVTFDRLISECDVDSFAQLSGDNNPLHLDNVYAQSTPYGERIVHGMFLGLLLSRLVGMHLPGRRALLMKESLEFKKPVRIGDTVTASGRLVSKSESTHILHD